MPATGPAHMGIFHWGIFPFLPPTPCPSNQGNLSFFHPGGMRRRNGYVSFSTVKEGQLFMAVSFAGRSLELEGRMVRVIAADGPILREFPLSHSEVLAVPQQFTVEVPSFVVDGIATAPLRADFAWTDRRYYRSVGAW